MLGRFLASTALAGLILVGAPALTLAQTAPSNGQTKAAPMHKGMKGGMAKGKMMGGPGHKLDNIADKLNACQAKPAAERGACMGDATK